jgi:hypothetical protein
MKRNLVVWLAVVAGATAIVPLTASAMGTDPNGSAKFLGAIQVNGSKATMRVRYRCASGAALWVSAKETKTGVSATKLMKEGSSKKAAGWWESHRNRFVCNSKLNTGTFTIDTVEKGSKGTLVPGSAWVQFCVTEGKTEATTKLILSQSAWVKVR